MWLSINLPYGDIYNSTRIMLTEYHTWELLSIKGDLEGKVIFTNYDGIYNYLLNYNGGTNSLLSTSKAFGIFVAVQDISKHNGG